MNRFETLCGYYMKKDFLEIESSFDHDNFASGDEKRAMKLLLRNNVNTASITELKMAERMGVYFTENGCSDLNYYQDRLKKIRARLKAIQEGN